MAVVPPMPKASVSTAAEVNTGDSLNCRTAYRMVLKKIPHCDPVRNDGWTRTAPCRSLASTAASRMWFSRQGTLSRVAGGQRPAPHVSVRAGPVDRLPLMRYGAPMPTLCRAPRVDSRGPPVAGGHLRDRSGATCRRGAGGRYAAHDGRRQHVHRARRLARRGPWPGHHPCGARGRFAHRPRGRQGAGCRPRRGRGVGRLPRRREVAAQGHQRLPRQGRLVEHPRLQLPDIAERETGRGGERAPERRHLDGRHLRHGPGGRREARGARSR